MYAAGPGLNQAPQFSQEAPINPKALTTLSGHTNRVSALVMLSNGFLASGAWDNTIKLWDVASGVCVSTLSGHTNNVMALAVLPNGMLASGSDDKSIKLWEVASGRCVSTLPGHTNGVSALVVLANGQLASGSRDRMIKIWNVTTGSCESTFSGHTEPVNALTLLPDGRLASGSSDKTIKVWNVATGKCEVTLSGDASVMALTVLPNGHLASGLEAKITISGSDNGTIKVWNVVTGKCEATLSGHTSAVLALTILPNGSLASGSWDQKIKVWNVVTGSCEDTLACYSHWVNAITVLPNGMLASGSDDKTIKVWDLGLRPVLAPAAMNLAVAPATHLNNAVVNTSIYSVPFGDFAAPASWDATVNKTTAGGTTSSTDFFPSVSDPFSEFDAFFSEPSSSKAAINSHADWASDFAVFPPTPPVVAVTLSFENGPGQTPQFRQEAPLNPEAVSTLTGHTNAVRSLAVLSNGLLASGSEDKTIKVWDVASQRCVSALLSHTDSVRVLAVLSIGQLASGSEDNTIKVWDVASGVCVSTLSGHTEYVMALAVLPNGFLASGLEDKTIKVWDVASGVCVSTLSDHTGYVWALAVLPNGQLASGSEDKMIKVWDVASQRCVSTLSGHTYGVYALAVLPNGQLASGSGDNTIKVWDVASHVCVSTLSGHTSSLSALAVLANGQLASGSNDNTIKVWDVASHVCVSTLSGHTDYVTALTVLLDGRLASGSADSTIKVWDLGLRPMAVQKATAAPRAASQPQKTEIGNPAREGVRVSPAPALKLFMPPTPPKSVVTTSEGSAQDGLPEFDGLSLAHIAGTISFDELEIGRKLGQGGFGVVNEALWQGATQVAIKQLLGQLDPDLIDEFQRETSVHARLRHPNIIMLYGICIEPLKVAMVLEFMASGSLYDVLKNPAELPWSLRISMALDLSLGLLYLHGQHIIHRDLKSLNILVDDRMRAKVSDFGLSKIKLTTASMTKGGGGTPHWMAPELFDEVANTPATDVYATGIVFWEIASRKLPYEGKNQMQIGRFVEKGNREAIPAGTPAPFATLMTRCWAQRAEDRPSMNDVVREMREIHKNGASFTGGNAGSSSAKTAAVDSGYAAFSRR